MSKIGSQSVRIVCPECGEDTYIGKGAIRTCTKCSWDIDKKRREEEDRIRAEEWAKLSPEEKEARHLNFQRNLKNLALILPWMIQ